MYATNSGFATSGNLTLTAGVAMTGEGFTWDETDCILTVTGDMNIDGNIKVPADTTITLNSNLDMSGYNIICEGDLTIDGAGQLTADYITDGDDVQITGTVTVNTQYYLNCSGIFTLDATATFNGMLDIYNNTSGNYDETFYGDVTIEDGSQVDGMFTVGTISFAQGSTLTINEGIQVSWRDYTIDWTNAHITNNGIICLVDGTRIDFAKITG